MTQTTPVAATQPRLQNESAWNDELFSLRRPKDARAGLASGAKSLGKGLLVGAAGLIAAPAIGAIQDGPTGFAKGIGTGILGAVALPVSGVAICATQIVRGVVATPNAVQQARQGKVWDLSSREWIDNPGSAVILDSEENQQARIRWAAHAADTAAHACSRLSADEDYYALLGVSRDATPEHIKKQYYLLARRCHPDKNPDDAEAKERFQKLGEAYQVLSNPELRRRYNQMGAEGLDNNVMDGGLFFTMLFGSDLFEHLIGELMIAFAARNGGDINPEAMQAHQQERVEKLTIMLGALLRRWVEGDEDGFREAMHAEAHLLVDTPFGEPLLSTIGKAYEMQAATVLGNFFENGFASLRQKGHMMKTQVNIAKSAIKVFQAQSEMERLERAQQQQQEQQVQMMSENNETASTASNGSTSASAAASSSSNGATSGSPGSPQLQTSSDSATAAAAAHLAQRAALEDAALPLMLDAMWAANVLDIECTLQKVCERVLRDPKIDTAVRRRRAEALRELGRIFRTTKGQEAAHRGRDSASAKQQMEDAMMRVVQKKFAEDDAAHGKTFT